MENEQLNLFEQLKRANEYLEKINQISKKKLEEINQLRTIEENLCEKLGEKPLQFDNEGKEIYLHEIFDEHFLSRTDDVPYDKRQEMLEQRIQDLQNLQVMNLKLLFG